MRPGPSLRSPERKARVEASGALRPPGGPRESPVERPGRGRTRGPRRSHARGVTSHAAGLPRRASKRAWELQAAGGPARTSSEALGLRCSLSRRSCAELRPRRGLEAQPGVWSLGVALSIPSLPGIATCPLLVVLDQMFLKGLVTWLAVFSACRSNEISTRG